MSLKQGIFLVVAILLLIFQSTLSNAMPGLNNTSKKDVKKLDSSIAIIDTESLFIKLSDELNLKGKIIRDYNDFIENYVPSELTSDAKQRFIEENLDRIMVHYADQVAAVVSQIVNQLITEKNISTVLNRRTFSIREAIYPHAKQREKLLNKSRGRTAPMPQTRDNGGRYSNFYDRSVLTTSREMVDLTEEALKIANKMMPNIRLISYRRILK